MIGLGAAHQAVRGPQSWKPCVPRGQRSRDTMSALDSRLSKEKEIKLLNCVNQYLGGYYYVQHVSVLADPADPCWKLKVSWGATGEEADHLCPVWQSQVCTESLGRAQRKGDHSPAGRGRWGKGL